MLDPSQRIRDTVIMTMLDMLLMLAVFNSKTRPSEIAKNHPRIVVVFNAVSASCTEEVKAQKIKDYKELLLDKAL